MTPADPLFVVTGAYGLVGRRFLEAVSDAVPLSRSAPPPGLPSFWKPATFLPPVDITNVDDVSRALESVSSSAGGRPMAVVHLAAMTNTKGTDVSLYERVNVGGTRNVMRAAVRAGAAFIHISTDYVFSAEEGKKEGFREADRPTRVPMGVYAASKFRAEAEVLDASLPRTAVARIAYPYGSTGSTPGLEKKMLGMLESARREKKSAVFFHDQKICPSYIPDVVRGLVLAGRRCLSSDQGSPVIYHLVGTPTTPAEFGGWIRELGGFDDVPVTETSVVGTPYAADLFLSSILTWKVLGGGPVPHREALSQIFREA